MSTSRAGQGRIPPSSRVTHHRIQIRQALHARFSGMEREPSRAHQSVLASSVSRVTAKQVSNNRRRLFLSREFTHHRPDRPGPRPSGAAAPATAPATPPRRSTSPPGRHRHRRTCCRAVAAAGHAVKFGRIRRYTDSAAAAASGGHNRRARRRVSSAALRPCAHLRGRGSEEAASSAGPTASAIAARRAAPARRPTTARSARL